MTTERSFQAKLKIRWVRGGINPEGKRMFRQVTVELPKLTIKKPHEKTKIVPPGTSLHLPHPQNVGTPAWQNKDVED